MSSGVELTGLCMDPHQVPFEAPDIRQQSVRQFPLVNYLASGRMLCEQGVPDYADGGPSAN